MKDHSTRRSIAVIHDTVADGTPKHFCLHKTVDVQQSLRPGLSFARCALLANLKGDSNAPKQLDDVLIHRRRDFRWHSWFGIRRELAGSNGCGLRLWSRIGATKARFFPGARQ